MSTRLERIEDNLGSRMSGNLYFDFGYIESAVYFLKNNRGHTPTPKCEEILNQFINNHITNQNYTVKNSDGTYTEYPLGSDISKCFNAWWRDQPSPRCLAQQQAEYERRAQQQHNSPQTMPALGSWHDVVQRVIDYQNEQELRRQIHEAQEGIPEGATDIFKANNTILIDKLLGKPENMYNTFLTVFRNVTSGQTDRVLEDNGIIDKYDRAAVKKHIDEMCKDPNAITALTDNDLPLQMDDVAEWVHDQLKGAAVYMQDSNTWYYQRDNKYMSRPDYKQGNPLNIALKDYWNLCNRYASLYPRFSRTIAQTKKELLRQIKTLKEFIGTVETHTEEEFNARVLKEGNFCTPNGLYYYTRKISDSNGLTKVATKANILDMTAQDINTCEGVQLFSDFMNSIQPNPETRNYLIGVIANAITGHRENEYTYIFHGSTGANGKSVLTGLLQDMLGDYYESYPTDSLVRHSQGNPEQAAKALENRRLVSGSEIGDGSTIDGGVFKRYFSNDSYRINEKFKAPYTVKPTHTLFLPVNQMPNFGSDPAVRRRLVVIPFTEHFVMNPNPRNPHEHKLDPNTLNNLIAHEDEIFTYLVCYAEQLRNGNITLTVPATVQHYGDDMVDETNILADFIECEASLLTEEQINNKDIPTPIVKGEELYERFLVYIAASGAYNPYKTYKAFISALLLKYPQLEKKNARTTDDKVVKGIYGIWLDPTTTAAKQLEAKRWNKELDAPSPFSTFKASIEYQDWINKKENIPETTNQAEQYATTEQENPERPTTDYKVDSLTNTPAPQYEYWKTSQSINSIGQQFAQNNSNDSVEDLDDPAGLF